MTHDGLTAPAFALATETVPRASLETNTATWDWGIVAARAERMSKHAHMTVSLCFGPGSATFDEVLP